MNKSVENRTVIVLGMHRSGTSALAGSLEASGLYLGETNEYSEDNQKGNRESKSIMTLHNDLMERNGGSWDNPVPNLKWDSIHRAMRDLIIQSYLQKPLWGFKDPRTLFTLNGWLRVLPDSDLVGIYRHPYIVAESLYQRNGFTHEKGLSLWVSYNRVLLWYYKNNGSFPIVEFSDDSVDFQNQLSLLIEKINLTDLTHPFFEASLRQSQKPDLSHIQHSSAALKIYDELCKVRIARRS